MPDKPRNHEPIGPEPVSEEQLVAYLDGELDPETAERVRQRLETDPDLRRQLESHSGAWAMLDELQQPQVKTDFTESTLEVVALAAQSDIDQFRATRPRRYATIAASLFAACFIGFFGVALVRPDPNRQLLEDLPVVERLDEYRQIDSLEFLQELRKSELFSEDQDDPQDLDARHQQIDQMTPSDKAQLYRLWERFEALPPEQRENIRQLEGEIAQDKHAPELKEVMYRYYQWCRTLPAYQRLELSELSVDERIAQIKKLKRQSEDADGLKKWFKAKSEFVADHLTKEQQKRLSAFGAYGKQLMLFRWMDDMTKKSGKTASNPLTDQDLDDLRSQLSETTRQALEKQTPQEQWQTIVERLNRHFRSQALRHRFNRNRTTHPSYISNEELAALFESLPPNRQDELLSLPAEDMLQQLQQVHIEHRSPKFRQANPATHPFRHAPGQKPPR